MTVSPAQIILYAADSADYQIALSAATVSGISSANVCGDFYVTWQKVAGAACIVIAVGAPANNALYYNPCGWANPAGSGAGTTPFVTAGAPQSTLHGADHYLNGAGQTGLDTLQLAVMLSYYAVFGRYPSGFDYQLPHALQPENTCHATMTPHQGCPC